MDNKTFTCEFCGETNCYWDTHVCPWTEEDQKEYDDLVTWLTEHNVTVLAGLSVERLRSAKRKVEELNALLALL